MKKTVTAIAKLANATTTPYKEEEEKEKNNNDGNKWMDADAVIRCSLSLIWIVLKAETNSKWSTKSK